MHGKTSHGRRPAASGHARLAAGQETPGSHSRPHVGTREAARAAPFAARWPLRSFLELGAVPCARLHARQVLWEWGLAACSENTELLVSELATNAVRASRAMGQAAVRIWLVSDRAQIVIFVWDASPQPPVRADPGEDAENGRGLLLVETLSERWGYFRDGSEGKVVWTVLLVPAEDAGLVYGPEQEVPRKSGLAEETIHDM